MGASQCAESGQSTKGCSCRHIRTGAVALLLILLALSGSCIDLPVHVELTLTIVAAVAYAVSERVGRAHCDEAARQYCNACSMRALQFLIPSLIIWYGLWGTEIAPALESLDMLTLLVLALLIGTIWASIERARRIVSPAEPPV